MTTPSGDPSSPDFDIDKCSFEINCPIETSYYGYVPNRGINIFFTSAYGTVILACLFFLILRWPAWRAYTIVLGLGAGLELAGFNLRTYGTENPWEINTFTYQLVFLTIAPVFMSASVYLSLEYISNVVGRGWFNISPKIYPRVFIPMDIIALVVQAGGGAKSSGEPMPADGSLSLGVTITVVGLAVQLVSLIIFFVFLVAIAVPRKHRIFAPVGGAYTSPLLKHHRDEESESEQKPREVRVKGFMIVVTLATVLIVIRSAYRVAELCRGPSGGLITNQWAFMIMDGLLILVATLLLAFGHPTLLLKEYYVQ